MTQVRKVLFQAISNAKSILAICTVRKLRESGSGTTFQALRERDLNAPCFTVSRNEYVQPFLKALKAEVGIGLKSKVRLWRALGQSQLEQDTNGRSGMLTPAASRSGSPNVSSPGRSLVPLLLDMPDFVSMTEGTHRELVDIKDETMNDKYNGHLKLDTVGLASDQVLILEEQTKNATVEEYVSDKTRRTAEDNSISITVTPSETTIPQKGKDRGLGQERKIKSCVCWSCNSWSYEKRWKNKRDSWPDEPRQHMLHELCTTMY